MHLLCVIGKHVSDYEKYKSEITEKVIDLSNKNETQIGLVFIHESYFMEDFFLKETLDFHEIKKDLQGNSFISQNSDTGDTSKKNDEVTIIFIGSRLDVHEIDFTLLNLDLPFGYIYMSIDLLSNLPSVYSIRLPKILLRKVFKCKDFEAGGFSVQKNIFLRIKLAFLRFLFNYLSDARRTSYTQEQPINKYQKFLLRLYYELANCIFSAPKFYYLIEQHGIFFAEKNGELCPSIDCNALWQEYKGQVRFIHHDDFI